MSRLSCEGLTVIYEDKKKGDVYALSDVSADFEDGSFTVILGPSGAGKSTLLKCFLGLLPYNGTLLKDGNDLLKVKVSDRGFAYVSQDYSLYPSMTVFDNLAFPLRSMGARGDEIRERVRAMSASLGISACLTRKPREISGGQQQRVALGRALIKEPDAIFLDEPLSNLDEQTRDKVRPLIKKAVSESGATALYVTHDVREGLSLADRVMVIDQGKIVFSGSPKEVAASTSQVVRDMLRGAGL